MAMPYGTGTNTGGFAGYNQFNHKDTKAQVHIVAFVCLWLKLDRSAGTHGLVNCVRYFDGH